MNTTIGTRIKMLRNELGLSLVSFGDKIKMTNSNISKMEKDLRVVTDRTITIICNEFSVSEKWLRTGEGEMFVKGKIFSLDEKAKEYNLSELEIDIMRGYMELPPETRNELIGLFGKIYSKHSETAATIENEIEAEVESYRRELEAEKKMKTLSASQEQRKGRIG